MLLRMAAGCLIATLIGPTVSAADPPPIIRIEEDWVVQVGAPDVNTTAPQITTVVGPDSDLRRSYVMFELNHRTQPSFNSGGMQLQTWIGDSIAAYRNYPNSAKLSSNDETITYTVAMSLVDGKIKYEVVNGQSSTWGAFGGQGYLTYSLSTFRTSLTDTYSLDTSVTNSRIGFAANRVKKFARTQVRFYNSSGLAATDSTERVIHALATSE
jgi:hypothetical protein